MMDLIEDVVDTLTDNRGYWIKYVLLRYLLISDFWGTYEFYKKDDINGLLACGLAMIVWSVLIVKEEIRIKEM